MASDSTCLVCKKTAYQQERLVADGRVFHKTCFRCKTCNGTLKLGSYASMDNETFCKPCFKKAFFSTGNYSTGFGKLKPQQEFDQKRGRSNSADPPRPEDGAVETASQPADDEAIVREPTGDEAETLPEAESASEPASDSPSEPAPEVAAEPEAADDAVPAVDTAAAAEPAPQRVEEQPAAEQPVAEAAAEPAAVRPSVKARDSATASAGSPTGKASCVVCAKTVYALEKLEADGRVFHKACFRCKHCNCVLKLGSYASMESETFCKPCFKKAFFSTGNYSTGFGKLKPQQEFDQKRGRSNSADPPRPDDSAIDAVDTDNSGAGVLAPGS